MEKETLTKLVKALVVVADIVGFPFKPIVELFFKNGMVSKDIFDDMLNYYRNTPRPELLDYPTKSKEIDEEIDLKPCPFCGGKAIRVQHPGHNWDGKKKHVNVGACHGLWYVGCPSPYFEGEVPNCGVHPAACWYVDLSEAEKVWNKQYKK